MQRKIMLSALVFIFALGCFEAFARLGLGLGTPVLYVEHPSLDYQLKPNQSAYRFGNLQIVNDQGMRSESLTTLNGRDLILVFGDSVLNGGGVTDHGELATTLATNDRNFFGNVSAGSWGPGNHLAWIEEYGFLNANKVILTYNSEDLDDLATFAPLNPNTHPTVSPKLASIELIRRYLPRYLPKSLGDRLRYPKPHSRTQPAQSNVRPVREDLARLLTQLHHKKIPTCAILHPTQLELREGPNANTVEWQTILSKWAVPVVDLSLKYKAEGETSHLYRENDNIHINADGQLILAAALNDCDQAAKTPALRATN